MASPHDLGKAKSYNRIKLATSVSSSLFTFTLLLTLILTGWSRELAHFSQSVNPNPFVALLIFAFIIGLAELALTFPLSYVSGYSTEHHFRLSNQTFGHWVWEQLKSALVSLPIATALLLALYFCLDRFGSWWWVPVGLIVTAFSVVLARLAPVMLFPLFYTFTPLPDGPLRRRILDLCRQGGVPVQGIYTFNISKNTRKGNAAFTGIGRSRRIILGDTLLHELSEDEILTVFAHELGHYVHRHIAIGIAVGACMTFVGLFITSRLYEWSLPWGGFTSVRDIAGLPLLALWLSLFGLATAPVVNMLSRRHEQQADVYAVRSTGLKEAFIAALRRLMSMNLSDPDPHPFIAFFFYSHPPMNRRIRTVEGL